MHSNLLKSFINGYFHQEITGLRSERSILITDFINIIVTIILRELRIEVKRFSRKIFNYIICDQEQNCIYIKIAQWNL